MHGKEVFVCDQDGCGKAAHLDGCVKQNAKTKSRLALPDSSKRKWFCHYCNEETSKLPSDPIMEFKRITSSKRKQPEGGKANSSKPTKKQKTASTKQK
jgi:hypothetical protein